MLNFPARVTHDQALQTAQLLQSQLSLVTDRVVLDASALTQFDSSALAVMLACRRSAMAAGKAFVVQGLPPKLHQLAGLYGVAGLLTTDQVVGGLA